MTANPTSRSFGEVPAIILATLLFTSSAACAAEKDLPRDQWPMIAVAKVFLRIWHLSGPIEIINTDRALIGGNLLVGKRPGTACTYQAGPRLTNEDPPTTINPVTAMIDFDRLDDTYEVGRTGSYYLFVVPGHGQAVCDRQRGSGDRMDCFSQLQSALTADEMTMVLRALRFVFSEVCPRELRP